MTGLSQWWRVMVAGLHGVKMLVEWVKGGEMITHRHPWLLLHVTKLGTNGARQRASKSWNGIREWQALCFTVLENNVWKPHTLKMRDGCRRRPLRTPYTYTIRHHPWKSLKGSYHPKACSLGFARRAIHCGKRVAQCIISSLPLQKNFFLSLKKKNYWNSKTNQYLRLLFSLFSCNLKDKSPQGAIKGSCSCIPAIVTVATPPHPTRMRTSSIQGEHRAALRTSVGRVKTSSCFDCLVLRLPVLKRD